MDKNINPANAITLTRFVLGLITFYLIFIEKKTFAIILYVIFLLLDIADGHVARWLGCQTRFGKNFDFITDGFIGFGILLILLIMGKIPTLFLILGLIPTILMLGGVIWSTRFDRGSFVQSRFGKLNGVVYYIIILLLMIEIHAALIAAYLLLGIMLALRIYYLKEIYDLHKKVTRKNKKKNQKRKIRQ